MKKILFSTAAILALSLSPSRAAQLLLNGNFEAPAQTTNGDHTTVNPTSWVVAATTAGDTTTAAATNTALDNLVRGTVTTGTGLIPGTNATALPKDPNDAPAADVQSFDGDGAAVYIYQDFTMTLASKVDVQVDFGGRDYNSGTTTAPSWQLLQQTGTNAYTVVASSGTITAPVNGNWVHTDTLPTATLANGATYRFAVSLPDADMVDGASITTVPEPSTYAEVGLGFVALLGWFGVKRQRVA